MGSNAKLLGKIPQLKGQANYVDWAESALMALEANGMDAVLSETKGEDNAQMHKTVRSTLLMNCVESVKKALKHKTTANEVWSLAKLKYGTPSPLRTAELLAEFYGVKLAAGQDVQVLINRKRDLVSILANANEEISDTKLKTAILVAVRSQFESIVVNAEPTITTITLESLEASLINAQEAKRSEFKNQNRPARAAAATIKCDHCGIIGHKEVDCWKKHPEKLPAKFQKKKATAKAASTTDDESPNNTESDSDYTWPADSACTQHMSGRRKWMSEYSQDKTKITVADNNVIMAKGKGKLTMQFKLRDGSRRTEQIEVLHVPALGKTNLFSVKDAVKGGHKMVFTEYGCEIKNSFDVLTAEGDLGEDGMYNLNVKALPPASARQTLTGEMSAKTSLSPKIGPSKGIPMELAHNRIIHRNARDLTLMTECTEGLRINTRIPPSSSCFCESCAIGKAKRKPFPTERKPRIKELCEVVWFDTCGPLKGISSDGKEHFITFTEDKSRARSTFLMQHKNEAIEKFKIYQPRLENRTGRKIKIVHADNAKEYLSEEFQQYLQDKGIEWQSNVEYASEQNLSERGHGVIMDAARAMIQHARLPKTFLGYAILTASHVLNVCPHPKIKKMTPHEILKGTKPDVSYLRVFGCDAYAHIPRSKRTKADAKAKKCIFVGYSDHQKGYRLYDPATLKVTVHRDVVFNENGFGDRTGEDAFAEYDGEFDDFDDQDYVPDHAQLHDSDDDADDEGTSIRPAVQNFEGNDVGMNQQRDDVNVADVVNPSSGESDQEDAGGNAHESSEEDGNATSCEDEDPDESLIVDGPRQRKPVERYGDMVHHNWAKLLLTQSAKSAGIEANFSNKPTDPENWEDAMNREDREFWMQAAEREFDSLRRRKTWLEMKPENVPKSVKPISSFLVLKIKVINSKEEIPKDNNWVLRFLRDGMILRYKARLVIRGYRQRKGVDYTETYAPVVRPDILRLVLALTIDDPSAEVEMLDIVTAFLYGNLSEDIYMNTPNGTRLRSKIVKLLKSLYGLKQAPREWHKVIDEFLVQKLGFKKVKSTSCLYVKQTEDGKYLFITLYVDDLTLAGNKQLIQDVKSQLKKRFDISDLGAIKSCIGIQIDRDAEKGTVFLHQNRFLEETLEKYGMDKTYPAPTPALQNVKLSKNDCPNSTEDHVRVQEERKRIDYRSAVSSLLWLLNTRPDISFAVGELSRFVSNPGPKHYIALKRVFRYLKGTTDYGILFRRSERSLTNQLTTFTDSDWAGNVDDRKSTSGYVIKLNDNLISSKNQVSGKHVVVFM
jgi:hypothetical protein